MSILAVLFLCVVLQYFNMNRSLANLARLLFIVSLPVVLIAGAIAAAFNTFALYHYGFEKYGISQVTGLAPAELDKAASGLIHYFNSDEERISISVIKNSQHIPLFNEREVIHLEDVKKLIWLDYRVLLAALTYAVVYTGLIILLRRNLRRLALAALWGSGITIGIVVLLGIGALFDFNQLFLQFHLISFSNDLWQLDPARDYLIMMFPQRFQNDFALFCIGGAGAAAVVLGALMAAYLRFSRINTAEA